MSEQADSPTESLIMRRPRLDDLPDAPMPEGFSLRLASGDDRTGLQNLLQAAFPEIEWNEAKVEAELFADPRVPTTFVIEADGRLVATASALLEPPFQPETGTLHWVAAHPEQAGKGLGSLVSIAVLNDLARRGNVVAQLRTDDGRLPAIQTYLKLGFEPDGATAARAERWQRVREKLAAHRKTQEAP